MGSDPEPVFSRGSDPDPVNLDPDAKSDKKVQHGPDIFATFT